MTLKFSLKLADNSKDIGRDMCLALLPDVSKFLDNIFNTMKNTIPDIVINSISSQPEYDSLVSGSLRSEFGIPDASSRISEIFQTIKSGVGVTRNKPRVVGSKISGGIKFQMIRSDFQDLLSLGASTLTTEKGSQLNWLQWLLLEGDSVIISDYKFTAGPSIYSRTGSGIMQQSQGAFWRVPPEFAGNISNNWITRAIEDASSEINKTITNLLR